MSVLKLATAQSITGNIKNNTTINAAYIDIIGIDIDVLAVKATIKYEYGNKVAGVFTPLNIIEADRTQEATLEGEQFSLIVLTPITPTEKNMNLYQVMSKRIAAMFISNGVVVQE